MLKIPKPSKRKINYQLRLFSRKVGIKRPEEFKIKISNTEKGRKQSPEWIQNRIKARTLNNKWHPSKEALIHMSECQIGKKHSEESKLKRSISEKGINNPFYGKHHTEETKLKISKSKKGQKLSLEARLKISFIHKGEKHHSWRGGTSNEKYPFEFNKILKEEIRKRDEYQCQLCFIPQNGHKLDVHHIDYNKYNLNKNNLISLCRSCHLKTNQKREYYAEYFKLLINPKEYENASI